MGQIVRGGPFLSLGLTTEKALPLGLYAPISLRGDCTALRKACSIVSNHSRSGMVLSSAKEASFHRQDILERHDFSNMFKIYVAGACSFQIASQTPLKHLESFKSLSLHIISVLGMPRACYKRTISFLDLRSVRCQDVHDDSNSLPKRSTRCESFLLRSL